MASVVDRIVLPHAVRDVNGEIPHATNFFEAAVTDCREICRAAMTCAPCALDAELDRVSIGRVPRYVEGSNRDGSVWAEYAGRMLHGTTREGWRD